MEHFGWELPGQAISIPSLVFLALIILLRGVGSGLKMLYIVCFLLFVSLFLFFIGKPIVAGDASLYTSENLGFFNIDRFFIVFTICFPAFTGMTAGVGFNGDLKSREVHSVRYTWRNDLRTYCLYIGDMEIICFGIEHLIV
jgi:hypothetical protein